MSIQSTVEIGRMAAENRIMKIVLLSIKESYRSIELASFENDIDIRNFPFDYVEQLDVANLSEWTDSMVEDAMDYPFIRLSMFENYRVV